MPRKARIDAPGAIYHIIVRGIERRKIYLDDFDRDNFLKRLGNVISETATPCFAWALIPNHAHLLLRTGTSAIATVMRRLLTGYAVSFNRRHRRHGQLFQNRYKTILCVDIALNGCSNAWQNYLKLPRRSCCLVANIPEQSKFEALYVTGAIENLG